MGDENFATNSDNAMFRGFYQVSTNDTEVRYLPALHLLILLTKSSLLRAVLTQMSPVLWKQVQ